jgi:hypothetical protein
MTKNLLQPKIKSRSHPVLRFLQLWPPIVRGCIYPSIRGSSSLLSGKIRNIAFAVTIFKPERYHIIGHDIKCNSALEDIQFLFRVAGNGIGKIIGCNGAGRKGKV